MERWAIHFIISLSLPLSVSLFGPHLLAANRPHAHKSKVLLRSLCSAVLWCDVHENPLWVRLRFECAKNLLIIKFKTPIGICQSDSRLNTAKCAIFLQRNMRPHRLAEDLSFIFRYLCISVDFCLFHLVCKCMATRQSIWQSKAAAGGGILSLFSLFSLSLSSSSILLSATRLFFSPRRFFASPRRPFLWGLCSKLDYNSVWV